MDEIGNMQEQMGNVGKEIEILRKNRNTGDKKHCNRKEDCL